MAGSGCYLKFGGSGLEACVKCAAAGALAVLEVVAEGLHEAVPVAAAAGGTLMLGVAAG